MFSYFIYKIISLGAPGGSATPTFLFWDPLLISDSNRANKLKFGTLVDVRVPSGKALALINAVSLHWARLVPGWVTVFGM